MRAVSADNGSEFRAEEFDAAVDALGAELRFISARRPQTNGCVERVQRTVLEECWRPTFARSLVPKFTALRRDLEHYLRYYNEQRAHLWLNGEATGGAASSSRDRCGGWRSRSPASERPGRRPRWGNAGVLAFWDRSLSLRVLPQDSLPQFEPCAPRGLKSP